MRQRPIEALLERIGGRFEMVNAVAARAEQLVGGDIPAIETSMRNPVLVAMEELALGKFHIVRKRPTVDQPIGAGSESTVSDNQGVGGEKRPSVTVASVA